MKRNPNELKLVLMVALLGMGCATDSGPDLDLEEVDEEALQQEEIEQAKFEPYSQTLNPVVFVHGCYPGPPLAPPPYENASSAAAFGPMLGFFQGNGYPADYVRQWVYDGPVCGSTIAMAWDLAQYVQQVRAETGASRVDIVTHSMGSLTTRVYIKFFGGRFFVRDAAILAGSSHGAGAAAFGEGWNQQFGGDNYIGATEMFPPYACFGESPNSVQYFLNGCLNPAGRSVYADETPGFFVNYLNIWLTNDEINQPNHVACLNQDFLGDCSDPVNVEFSHVQPLPDGTPAHVAMLFDPQVVQAVFQHVTP